MIWRELSTQCAAERRQSHPLEPPRAAHAYDETQLCTSAMAGIPATELLSRIDANETLIEVAGVNLLSYVAPGYEDTALRDGTFFTEEVNGQPLVLEGEATFVCGERTWLARPGAFVVLPCAVYGFRIGAATPARMLQMSSAPGLEHFFRDAGRPAPKRDLPPPEAPDVVRLRACVDRYGIELLAPPSS